MKSFHAFIYQLSLGMGLKKLRIIPLLHPCSRWLSCHSLVMTKKSYMHMHMNSAYLCNSLHLILTRQDVSDVNHVHMRLILRVIMSFFSDFFSLQINATSINVASCSEFRKRSKIYHTAGKKNFPYLPTCCNDFLPCLLAGDVMMNGALYKWKPIKVCQNSKRLKEHFRLPFLDTANLLLFDIFFIWERTHVCM